MRARDAENVIAGALIGEVPVVDSEGRIAESVLLGLRRSKPIYVRKVKEKEAIRQRRRHLFYRGMLFALTYPIRALSKILFNR